MGSKGAQALTRLCGGCNSCGAKLSKLNIGVTQFTSMQEAEKQSFWKKARGLSKLALQTYCEDTLTNFRSVSTKTSTKTRPMPLKYYEDMGFNEQHVKDTTPPEDISTVHGTTCYSLPLSMMENSTTDETKRSQTLTSAPKTRTVSASPRPGQKGKLPQEGVDRGEWSEEQAQAFTKHVEDVAGKELSELDAKLAEDFAPYLPYFVKDDVRDFKEALQCASGTVKTHADLKALKEWGAKIKTHVKAYKTAFEKHWPATVAPGAEGAQKQKQTSKTQKVSKDKPNKPKGKAKGKTTALARKTRVTGKKPGA